MGFWKSERGINGDSWADEMGRCMKALSKTITYGDKEHEITMAEFADLIEFCSRGHLVVELRSPNPYAYPEDGKWPLSRLHDKEVKTYPNRGQIHR